MEDGLKDFPKPSLDGSDALEFPGPSPLMTRLSQHEVDQRSQGHMPDERRPRPIGHLAHAQMLLSVAEEHLHGPSPLGYPRVHEDKPGAP